MTTAVVTGASAGIGREFCYQLASRCSHIVAVARRGERLASLQQDLHERCEVEVVAADLRTVEGQSRLADSIRQRGPLAYLVNNAGFGSGIALADAPIDSELDMVRLHVDAVVVATKAALPAMLQQGSGAIITVSSIGVFHPYKGVTYCASKAFADTFSEGLALEVAGSGIVIQSLLPGFTQTEFYEQPTIRDITIESIPESHRLSPGLVVAESLKALSQGSLRCIPGEAYQVFAREQLASRLRTVQ